MNFDKERFSEILVKIKDRYGSINQMAEKTGVTAAYISKLIRLMYDNAPSPEILKKIGDNSNEVTSYKELMDVCGYLNPVKISDLLESDNIMGLINKSAKDTGIIQLELNLNTDDFSNEEIKILQTYISSWEKGKEINIDTLIKNCSTESKERILREYTKFHDNFKLLLQKTYQQDKRNKKNTDIKHKYYMCPVYGQISAGEPNWAEECLEGQLPIDPNLMEISNPEEYFFLRVSGESMNNVIKNGAFALIHKQDMVDDGEIAVVLVNGFDATLKKFTKKGDVNLHQLKY